MINSKDDDYYINKIILDLQFISIHMNEITIEQFNHDELLQDSMMFRMIQISENPKKLSNTFKSIHNNIPWYAISGLRNRIVHDYGNVDLSIIYETLKNDIPSLLEKF
jgi:uncharacterized protein with HEPN domain